MKIQLRENQYQAVQWAEDVLRQEGGILFSDAPGFGKSYQAIALAQRLGLRPVVFAPRALVPMWENLLERYRITGRVHRYGELRRDLAPCIPDQHAIIVDEAHHFVNPKTQRYHDLAQSVFGIPTILLTATPFQNRLVDALHLLALFSGEARWVLDRPALWVSGVTSLMARLSTGQTRRQLRPVVRHTYSVDAPVDMLKRLAMALCTDGESYALTLHWLLSSYLSSHSAWTHAYHYLKRYIHESLLATRTGKSIPRAQFRRDFPDGQRAFSFLLEESHGESKEVKLQRALNELQRAYTYMDHQPQRSWAWLKQLDRPVVVFSRYVSTVDEIAFQLRASTRIVRWKGSGVEANFPLQSAPLSSQLANTILVATDVAAEGIDLRSCHTLVHADLHWNPHRTTQREGRVRRDTTQDPVHIWTPTYTPRVQMAWRLAERQHEKRQLPQRFKGKQFLSEAFETNPPPTPDGEPNILPQYLSAVLQDLRCGTTFDDHLSAPSYGVTKKSDLLPIGASFWLTTPHVHPQSRQQRLHAIQTRLQHLLDRRFPPQLS